MVLCSDNTTSIDDAIMGQRAWINCANRRGTNRRYRGQTRPVAKRMCLQCRRASFPSPYARLNSLPPHPPGGGAHPMSQSGLTAEPGVAWPSNGISEVPFRLYTDPRPVPARAGAPVQGPDLELPLPRGRTRQTRRLRRHHDRRDRGDRRARRGRRDQRLRQPLRPSRQPAVPGARTATSRNSAASITAGPTTSPAS